tara:strand:+ start:1168 stop:1401 length:234 start_codon:yes stop_codon:yes gene_type:complete
MNPKHKRYLEEKRAGKSVAECAKAAVPGSDPKSDHFKWWASKAETEIPEIKDTIELEGLNKPKKAAPKKKPEPTEGE